MSMSMWRVLQMCGIGPGYSYEDQGRLAAASMPLDPIDVAHSFEYRKLVRPRPFGRQALQMLTDGSYFRSNVLDGSRVGLPSRETALAYAGHLRELERSYVLQRIARETVNPMTWIITCGYFAVTKPGKAGARSILNGRPVSSRCHVPPTVNLADVTDVIAYFKTYRGRPSFAVMDFRHYFHQIGLSKEVYQHFRIRCGTDAYFWTTLPMGWSYSPYLAQALSWCVIIEAIEAVGLKHSVPSDAETLPESIRISRGEDEARVFLTYDNVALIGEDNIVTQVHASIVRICQRLNLKIKDGSETSLSYKKMDFENDIEAIHLGVRFGTVQRRRAIAIAPSAIERWTRVLEDFSGAKIPTRRLVARCAGIILHQARVFERPLWRETAVIAVIRRLAREKGAWDAPFVLAANERDLLLQRLRLCVQNTPHVLDARNLPAKKDAVVVAADASDDHGGIVIIGQDGEAQHVEDFDLVYTEHIFIKEMRAALCAVRKVLQVRDGSTKGLVIHLLEDNSAVGYALRRGLTASAIAQPILAETMTLLATAGATLRVHIVPGVVNPADEPSRRKPLDRKKVAMWSALYNEDFFMPRFTPEDVYKGSARIRHAEPVEDEAEPDVLNQFGQWMCYGEGEEDPADLPHAVAPNDR